MRLVTAAKSFPHAIFYGLRDEYNDKTMYVVTRKKIKKLVKDK